MEDYKNRNAELNVDSQEYDRDGYNVLRWT